MNDKSYNLIGAIQNTFSSKLYTVKLEDKNFKHLDYFPMINARAHTVGDIQNWTLNNNFKSTFNKFLKAMAEHASSNRSAQPLNDSVHKMMMVQYM